MKKGDTINYHGVAATVVGEGDEPYERVIVMVGDDRYITVVEGDFKVIDEDAYCGGCGQIGCIGSDGELEVPAPW